MAVFDKVTLEVQERMEEISLILMRYENKDFCLAKVHSNSWRLLSYSNNHKEYRFILVPSPAFERLIIQREYRVSGFFRLVTPYVRNKVVPLPYGTDQATTRHSSGCAYRQLRCCKF